MHLERIILYFGGRMIQQLIRYEFIQEAYDQAKPMVERVKLNDGFYGTVSIISQRVQGLSGVRPGCCTRQSKCLKPGLKKS